MQIWKIGPWIFDAGRNELSRNGGDRIRLEDRSARLLARLAESGGEVVSKQALIDGVWDGRALSENSVAVVISDLRKALGDSARDPTFIETVPKRGYRLNAAAALEDEGSDNASRRAAPPPIALVAIIAALFVAASSAAWVLRQEGAVAPATVVTISEIQNSIDDAAFDRMANSISELGAGYLAERSCGAILIRDRWDFGAEDPARGLYEDFGEDARVFHVSAQIIIDGGTPIVALSANDPKTDEIVWAGNFNVSAGAVAPLLYEALDEFLVAVENRINGGGKSAPAMTGRGKSSQSVFCQIRAPD